MVVSLLLVITLIAIAALVVGSVALSQSGTSDVVVIVSASVPATSPSGPSQTTETGAFVISQPTSFPSGVVTRTFESAFTSMPVLLTSNRETLSTQECETAIPELSETGFEMLVNSCPDVGYATGVDMIEPNPFVYLEEFDGKPGFMWQDPGAASNVYYVYATNSTGSGWNARKLVSSMAASTPNAMGKIDGRAAFFVVTTGPASVEYSLATDFAGTSFNTIAIPNANADASIQISFAMVAGNPAITSSSATGVVYSRSSTTTGSAVMDWPAAVDIPGTTYGDESYLSIIDGNPAVLYAASGELFYVRATDTTGTTWGAPIMVIPNNATWLVSQGVAIQLLEIEVGGVKRPMAHFYNAGGTNPAGRWFLIADDASGTSWTDANAVQFGTVNTSGFQAAEMTDGRVLIAFVNNAGGSTLQMLIVDGDNPTDQTLINTVDPNRTHEDDALGLQKFGDRYGLVFLGLTGDVYYYISAELDNPLFLNDIAVTYVADGVA